MKVRVNVLVAPPMPAHVRPGHAVNLLLLFCRQPDVRHQGHRQGDKHSQANSSPVTECNLDLFHINAEYQPETSS